MAAARTDRRRRLDRAAPPSVLLLGDKPVRALLWGYLALNILFGASVAFDVFGGNALDDVASGGMACVSLALAGLLVASGGVFEQVTGWLYRRQQPSGDSQNAERYLHIVRRYADVSVAVVLALTLCLLAAMLSAGWGNGRSEEIAKAGGGKTASGQPPRQLGVLRRPAAAP